MKRRRISWPRLTRSLIAILRGIKPDETADIVRALMDAGFEAIEIPLNSPEPFRSIEIAVKAAEGLAPGHCLIGAGTVLSAEDVDRLADAGGRLMISPNVEPEVVSKAAGMGMVTMPGVFTASEALAAVGAGASALKFFPASILGPSGISAIRAVLPQGTETGAVGGVSESDFADYARSGIRTFGLGSSLYKPGSTHTEITQKARRIIAAYDAAFQEHRAPRKAG